ncbi:MAG: hypothetical protein IPP22_02035 [Nitrosomonas sp.]|nr:hypothetical protein [Nitrosomonas sp.]
MDNLNTHKIGSLGPFQSNKRTIWREDWNSITPQAWRWLNIAEIELAVLSNVFDTTHSRQKSSAP